MVGLGLEEFQEFPRKQRLLKVPETHPQLPPPPLPPQLSQASKSAAAATDADLNPDACLLVSGNDAVAKVGFNIQLAYSSQSPVTELPPSTQVR